MLDHRQNRVIERQLQHGKEFLRKENKRCSRFRLSLVIGANFVLPFEVMPVLVLGTAKLTFDVDVDGNASFRLSLVFRVSFWRLFVFPLDSFNVRGGDSSSDDELPLPESKEKPWL